MRSREQLKALRTRARTKIETLTRRIHSYACAAAESVDDALKHERWMSLEEEAVAERDLLQALLEALEENMPLDWL